MTPDAIAEWICGRVTAFAAAGATVKLHQELLVSNHSIVESIPLDEVDEAAYLGLYLCSSHAETFYGQDIPLTGGVYR